MKDPTASLIRPFYPALDGLRAIAIMLVFAMHSAPFIGDGPILKWGWVGVDLFFVLSGFLITGILYDTLDKPHFFRNFYIRRTLRIFPLFYSFWILLLILTPFIHLNWNRYLVASAAYMGNLFLPGAFAGLHPNPFSLSISKLNNDFAIGHIWTLCVEEQFYLIWPAIVWFVRSRTGLLRLCVITVLVAPFFRWFLYLHLLHPVGQPSLLYSSTFTRVDTLLVGAAIALCLRGPLPSMRTIRQIYWGLITLPPSLLAACLLSRWNYWPVNYNNPLVDTLGFTLIALIAAGVLLAAIDGSSVMSRALTISPLIAIGRLSYGIYFIHLFPLQALGSRTLLPLLHHHVYLIPIASAVVTYAAAWLSFHYLESPFLRLKDRWAPHPGKVSDPPPATTKPLRGTSPFDLFRPAA